MNRDVNRTEKRVSNTRTLKEAQKSSIEGNGLFSCFGKWIGLIWCILYATCSISLSILNKMLFSRHGFKLFFVLSTGQLLASVVLSILGSKIFPTIVKLRLLKFTQLLKILPLSIVNSMNAVLGFAGLRLVNIPMFLVLRRLTTPLVLFFEYFFMNKIASPLVKKAIGVAMVGTLIAGSSDLTFNLFGYLFTFSNNFCTAAYLILIKILGTKSGPDPLSSFELVFWNSLMSLPIMSLLAFITGEINKFYANEHTTELLVLFTISCGMGFIFNFIVFMCTSVNSPLATSVTGNIKDCLATLLGYLVFDDAVLQFVNVLGVLVSLTGGMVYSYAKLKESGKLDAVDEGAIKRDSQTPSKRDEENLEFPEHWQKDGERVRLLSGNGKEASDIG